MMNTEISILVDAVNDYFSDADVQWNLIGTSASPELENLNRFVNEVLTSSREDSIRELLCEVLQVSLLNAPQSIMDSFKESCEDRNQNVALVLVIFIELGLMPPPSIIQSVAKIILCEPGNDVTNHILEVTRERAPENRFLFAKNLAVLLSQLE
ncbi:hypothetical protein N7539_007690 [Penicillium diatomitis]|uniref:Uncharacterized protein n=1 Tax=Penicillium diatomitis TaxID=2819901 RepID=A0A9W9WLQ8_9EURO|nr:uncharacterized protein N7539_009355 [Penicillium diatomitis]XP_056787156.1 uncharacterized protein N7539_007690 [Penicillium diatomitis]KAJ5469737.1 hypothetical protein N7539_009355 [Penicillium diatomitis]KAJ5475403.1 hypothetical protein N7539_007690 [Penicillium diatomitis]